MCSVCGCCSLLLCVCVCVLSSRASFVLIWHPWLMFFTWNFAWRNDVKSLVMMKETFFHHVCVCVCAGMCDCVWKRQSERDSVGFFGVGVYGGLNWVTKGSNLCVYVFSCVNCIMSSGEHIVSVSETPWNAQNFNRKLKFLYCAKHNVIVWIACFPLGKRAIHLG